MKILVFAVFSLGFFSAQANDTCGVTNISSSPRTFATTEVDRFQNGKRDQVIQYSYHMSDQKNVGLEGLLHQMEVWDTFDEQDRLFVLQGLRSILGHSAEEIAEVRADLSALTALHEQQPFTYIGVEFPQDTPNDLYDQEHVERAQRAQRLFREVLSDHYTEQEVEDLLLYFLGDEYYSRLPGQVFAGLPAYGTEDAELRNAYYDSFSRCQWGVSNAGMVMVGSSSEPQLWAFASWVSEGDKTDSETYHRLKSEFLAGLRRETTYTENFEKMAEMIEGCDVFPAPDRDQATAQILSVLPEGRGLIFRGTLHQGYLNRFLNQSCGPGGTPPTGDNKTDQGTE